MDWHFRVHQRMVDAERRGQSRSWFVDEMDWIRSRESDEEHLASSDNATDGAAGGGAAQQGKAQYVAVPDDPVAAHAVCPICQEKFEMKWLDEAQEFVWMDAVRVGSRVYHASCRAETRDSPAPETGVLGKRKNAEDHLSVRTKIKSEP
jgi:pre-mRNA cleavage complex 2 protein Pcf11